VNKGLKKGSRSSITPPFLSQFFFLLLFVFHTKIKSKKPRKKKDVPTIAPIVLVAAIKTHIPFHRRNKAKRQKKNMQGMRKDSGHY
jgi:hypothetical protein